MKTHPEKNNLCLNPEDFLKDLQKIREQLDDLIILVHKHESIMDHTSQIMGMFYDNDEGGKRIGWNRKL